MTRLLLDTGVLVGAVRGRIDIAVLADADDVAVPAVVVAEYLAGVLLDGDPSRAAAQRAFLDELLAVVPVHPYDHDVAVHHAALLAHVHRGGRARGAHDLIVAATARATARTMLTTDARGDFADLPDVTVRLVSG